MKVIQRPVENWIVEIDPETMVQIDKAFRMARDVYMPAGSPIAGKSDVELTDTERQLRALAHYFDRLHLQWERMMDSES